MNETTQQGPLDEVSNVIAMLEEGAKLKDVIAKVNEIVEKLNEQGTTKVKDRGPESTREMTEDDAYRVIFGDLKDIGHRQVAEGLGLSYGQVYSARKGFTFKPTHKAGPKVEDTGSGQAASEE